MGAIITLTLALAATLEGTVRLPNGSPAKSIVVAAIPHEGGWWDVGGVARTAGDGGFRLADLPPDRYALTVTSPRHGSLFIEQVSGRVRLTLPGGGRTLRGIARHADGEPLRGRVLAHRLSEHEHDLFVMETDGRGRFSAMLPPARYRIYTEGADGKVEQTVDLRNDDATIALRLERIFHVTPPAVVDWVRREAVPLTSDVSALGRIVGDARIVALGESTHGSREFFQLKHQIIRYLVEQMGFGIVAMETGAADAAAVNEFILHGRGETPPADAWNTEEIREMVRWMRQYNEEHCPAETPLIRRFAAPSPRSRGEKVPPAGICVRFYGFDMQDPVGVPASSLDPEWKRRLVEQGEQLLRVTARANEVRDRFMAENVEWILDQHPPGTKIVLWAHNGHVAAEGPQLLGGESMGYHLRRRYGREMRIIGFAFDRGRFRAGSEEYEAPPAKAASLDGALAAAGLPLFAIDLRTARGVVRRWLDSPVEQRFIGTTYNPAIPGNYWSVIHPGRSYDAIIFVRETTPARADR